MIDKIKEVEQKIVLMELNKTILYKIENFYKKNNINYKIEQNIEYNAELNFVSMNIKLNIPLGFNFQDTFICFELPIQIRIVSSITKGKFNFNVYHRIDANDLYLGIGSESLNNFISNKIGDNVFFETCYIKLEPIIKDVLNFFKIDFNEIYETFETMYFRNKK